MFQGGGPICLAKPYQPDTSGLITSDSLRNVQTAFGVATGGLFHNRPNRYRSRLNLGDARNCRIILVAPRIIVYKIA